jgi:homospermidine synthase
MDHSLQYFFKNHPDSNASDIIMYANQEHTFRVLDQRDGKITGQDSIGATLFCGTNNMERIFWCGSIVTDNDQMIKNHPYFTPTIIQVAAGVLSGLSFLLEHKCKGWYQSSDINTTYMLKKCAPLLGQLFFTEIPVEQFNEPLTIKIEKMIPYL